MNKKGILFTVLSLFLFISLAIMSYAYFERSLDKKLIIVDSNLGNKINYINNDIIQDVLNFGGVSVPTLRTESGGITLSFKEINPYLPAPDYSSYETWAENFYAAKTNTEVDLVGIGGGATIEPYNIELTSVDGELLMLTDYPNLINWVNISITVYNVTTVATSQSPNDDGAPYPYIYLSVLDEGGGTFFQDTVRMNPAQNNNNFFVQFQNNERLSIYFENDPQDGTLRINNVNLDYKINYLEVNYDIVGPVEIEINGSVSINPNLGNIRKESNLLL